jgi:ribosomal protein L6P/L9E
MYYIKTQYSPARSIFYTEGNVIYISSIIATVKMKTPSFVILFSEGWGSYTLSFSLFNRSFITKSCAVDYQQFNAPCYYIFAMVSYIVRAVSYGSIGQFRLLGRGYKTFPFINTYMFKLGLAHSLYYTLPISVRLRKKTKKMRFYKILGLWPHKVQQYLSEIKSFRIPDVYCAKGIFSKHMYFVQKEGKKAFTL